MSQALPTHRLAFLLLLLSIVALAPPAGAQTPRGLKTHFRLVNSMSESYTPGEYRGGDGWTTTGPLVRHCVNNISNPLGMYSNSDFTAIADYGHLRFYGSGSAQSALFTGLFLWVDDWIGAEPRAQYRDRLYVNSATLPIGTPAVVEFELTLSGSTTIVDSSPSSSFTAELTAQDPNLVPVLSLSLGNAPGVTTGQLNTAVGDSIDVQGRLAVYLYAYGMLQAGPSSGSVAADVTAQVVPRALTQGVTLTSNSNTVDVPPPAVVAFALEGARPNPARSSRLAIRFTLPSGDAATLALYDLRGRCVDRAEVGGLGAGAHVVELAKDRRLAPGIYLARLTRAAESRTARVIVVD
jgi:hypothetical protein